MTTFRIPAQMLGRSGYRLDFPGVTVFLDPSLSDPLKFSNIPNSEGPNATLIKPESVSDVDIVLITTSLINYCDPYSLTVIANALPKALFVGPKEVVNQLLECGIENSRLRIAEEHWSEMAPKFRVLAVPAAHPEIQRDEKGRLEAVSYLLEFEGQQIYFAGGTFVRQEIIDVLNANGPIHTAFLPVNEHNFFQRRRGIMGNMTVREAFQFADEIGVQQVVAIEWDEFAMNGGVPDEIRLIHQRTKAGFSLLLNPTHINLTGIQASIVIRTLNEARYLGELLDNIHKQNTGGINYEVVLVDSGSTDATLTVAENYGCRILHITRETFSFGRSLNIGCAAAQGDMLVITSGHCVPVDENWLAHLCLPLLEGKAEYVYGRQLSGPESHYSEGRIFAKYFPEISSVPQRDFFCNNANSALLKSVWQTYQFDEELTGLEDMDFAQRMQRGGGRVAYIAEAGVYHHHNETWSQVRRRFEREAIALQKIMPQVQVGTLDAIRYIVSSIWFDWSSAKRLGHNPNLRDIINYRTNQFVGSLKGNHQHRKMSRAEKEKYFYPS